jgi:hypothetical protein
MITTQLKSTLRRSLLALALATSSALASAASLHVEIDTAGFGSNGWIDLLFSPGNGSAALAAADLSHFSGMDLPTAADFTGDYSINPASYTLLNSNGGSDLLHSVNFGGKISFDVAFSGAADAAASRALSAFSVVMYNADFSAQLGNVDPVTGSLLQLTWTPSSTVGGAGSVGAMAFDNAASVTAAVPEPSTWLMLGAGLALVGLARKRKIG